MTTDKGIVARALAMLFKETRRRLFAFPKVTQPDTDQAKALLRVHIHPLPQGQCDGGQLLTG